MTAPAPSYVPSALDLVDVADLLLDAHGLDPARGFDMLGWLCATVYDRVSAWGMA